MNEPPFRTNLSPQLPYEYIHTSLDLTGAKNGETFYFNLDEDFDYLTVRDYYRYIQIVQSSIVGDVLVWTDPPVVATAVTPNGPLFTIGGAPNLQSPVVVPYAAPIAFGPKVPPQFSGAPLTLIELNSNPINYFGHSAAKFPYGQDNAGNPDARTNLRYLAITISSVDVPVGTVLIESGVVYVTLKVYSK
jgi:hypothetical protein